MNHDFDDLEGPESHDGWTPIIKTGTGAGDIFVERNAFQDKIRFTLIENHGLHMETKIFDGDYSGPIKYDETRKFIEQCQKEGTL